MSKKKHKKLVNIYNNCDEHYEDTENFELDEDFDYDEEYDCEVYSDAEKLPVDIAYIITKRILKNETLLVVGNNIYQYNNEIGCFCEISAKDAEMLIERYYSDNELRLAKPSLAVEIKTRILRCPELQADFDDFNANPGLINCKNGVVVIGKDECTLMEHSPRYKFTYCVHAKYLEEDRKAKTFAEYCRTSLGDEKDSKKLLLQIIGYCCSDMTDAKKAFFFKGAPDSGKSLMIHFIEKLVGIEMVSNIPLHQLGDRFNKACLFGKKINTQGEMKNKKLREISTLKAITGGDRISAEFKRCKIFTFTPKAKLLFAGNALPLSAEAESTRAYLNRICLLTFPNSIPREAQDKTLGDKLWAERNAIFTKAVNTLPKLVAGKFEFASPDDSKEYLKYFESTSNSLDMFLSDSCTFNANASVPVHEFVKAYTAYCERNALEVIGKIKIGSHMLEKYKIRRSRIHRKDANVHHFIGIQFAKTIAD